MPFCGECEVQFPPNEANCWMCGTDEHVDSKGMEARVTIPPHIVREEQLALEATFKKKNYRSGE